MKIIFSDVRNDSTDEKNKDDTDVNNRDDIDENKRMETNETELVTVENGNTLTFKLLLFCSAVFSCLIKKS